MKEIKKYTDVIRYGKSGTEGVLRKGDLITITEKIDGANASFRLDEDNKIGVSCYSRNTLLDKDNNLRGFYEWVNDNIVPIKNKLNKNYIYYGEWLIKHKVNYKKEFMNNFYLFSIYDVEKEEYVDEKIVFMVANKLNLKIVPLLYSGEFISYEHLLSFVGKSDMTEEKDTGEGIVVKNSKYKDKYGNQCFVKLVSNKFREVQKQKAPKNPNENEMETVLVTSVLTKARVEKMLYKLVDEGELKNDFAIEDMGLILRLLNGKLYDDIMKEESDMFKGYKEDIIKKIVNKRTPPTVREVLKDIGRA